MSVNPRINISTINSIETKTACFNGVRYYDPSLQRFLGEDPIGFDGLDYNFYAYVGQDPINLIDPTGLGWMDALGRAKKGNKYNNANDKLDRGLDRLRICKDCLEDIRKNCNHSGYYYLECKKLEDEMRKTCTLYGIKGLL